MALDCKHTDTEEHDEEIPCWHSHKMYNLEVT